jgi:glutathione S-transferase
MLRVPLAVAGSQAEVMTPAAPLRLYGFPLSGHSHRAELMLSLMGLPFEKHLVDLRAAEHKAPAFLAKNPLGQVPVLEDGELTLPDSNAILVYLAQRYDASQRWLPREPAAAAQVQRWLSIAAGDLCAGPCALRLAAVFGAKIDPDRAHAITQRLFTLMNDSLASRAFLLGAEPTIADVAMYTYTAHAPEGGAALEPYPNVRAWLGNVELLPGFVPMRRTPSKAA